MRVDPSKINRKDKNTKELIEDLTKYLALLLAFVSVYYFFIKLLFL